MTTTYSLTPIPQPELSTCRAWDVFGGREPYVVRCDAFDEWTCSCPDFKFRRALRRIQGGCVHIKAGRDQLELEAMEAVKG